MADTNRIVVLIPAHNEADSIRTTLDAVLNQERPADQVVVIPNGCTDNTADIARTYPVTVMELPKLEHRKSEALNRAWSQYARDADVVICLDADTELPPNALKDWAAELEDASIGGSSSKFTMLTPEKVQKLCLRMTDSCETHTSTRSAADSPRIDRVATRGTSSSRLGVENSVRDMPTESSGSITTGQSRVTYSSAIGATTETASISLISSSEVQPTTPMTHALKEDLSAVRIASMQSSPNQTCCTSSTPVNVVLTSPSDTGSASRSSAKSGTDTDGRGSQGSARSRVGLIASHLHGNLLTRLQAAEFAAWTSTALRKGDTHVLAGTGCAMSGQALREVAARDDRVGPWSYDSATEDFELSYRLRELGYRCQVSPTVRAYTDSMRTLKALMAQRHKWSVGTVEDLLTFGVNRLTLRDWGQQVMGIFGAFLKALWLVVIFGQWAYYGELNVHWVWWLLPVLFVAVEVKRVMRVPHRDWKDIVLAVSFFPNEFFMWLRSAWFIRSWAVVLTSKITGRRGDVWGKQYEAEGA